MIIDKGVAEKFYDFVTDWNYETYVAFGGYGSGKSYNIALKIILRCLQEKTKILVIREVYATITESCYDLIREILDELNLFDDTSYLNKSTSTKVKIRKSPLSFIFPNGSRIIFKGMDNPDKVKSINDVSVVWIEEASEVKYAGYKELLGRIRTRNKKLNYILSFNPVGEENWTYRHFFVKLNDKGEEQQILDVEEVYKRGTLIHNGVYFHHSLPEDNPFLPMSYLKRLDSIKEYDPILWGIARQGRFGAAGTRVLPRFEIANNPDDFKAAIMRLPLSQHRVGMDFGFEESYNAVISMCYDLTKSILYIYDEIYQNKITDDLFAQTPKMQKLKQKQIEISADCASPKDIQYYRQCGFNMRKCKKYTRADQTRKIKRFKQIICSPKCINVIRELKSLTYKKDKKGNVIYDEFNIDPHTFSAIWYGLDNVTVADIKETKRNSVRG